MPYYLIGHSAGGQFLARTSAFVDTGAARIVAANPGTHLFPVKDAEYPLGFGKLPAELTRDEQLLSRFLRRWSGESPATQNG